MPKILYALFSLVLLGLSLEAQEVDKFKTEAGMVFLGGEIALSFHSSFSGEQRAVLNLHFNPLFGQFLTRQIMVFTHLDFNLDIGLSFPLVEGFISIGVQGRYYFFTGGVLNFFTGLQLAFGSKITDNINNLHEHIACGLVGGLFFPVNERIGFDLSLSCLVAFPLNTIDPANGRAFLALGILSII